MSFLKRTFHAVSHYKKNTLLLLLIFTILSTLILSGLCIRSASQSAYRKSGIEIGGSVMIQSKAGAEGEAQSAITLESAQKAAALDGIKEFLFASHTLACTRGFPSMGAQFDDMEAGDYDVTLLGANGTHPELRDDCRMLEGRRPGPEDKGFAVIHEWVSTSGNIHAGDTITVSSRKMGDDVVELEVLGVYLRNAGYHFGSPEAYVENTIFTDLDTVEKIGGSSNLRWAEFVMEDPADIPDFLNDLENMNFPEREKLGFITLDGEYRKIAMSMESLVNMATLIFSAAVLLGVVILTAMVMISLSGREYEIGVLLSMGENRGRVILQLTVETLIPVLLGITVGVAVSNYTASLVGDLLGAAQKGITVTLDPSSIGAVYLCGVAITLAASCVTAYKVLRFQPKKLMMAIE